MALGYIDLISNPSCDTYNLEQLNNFDHGFPHLLEIIIPICSVIRNKLIEGMYVQYSALGRYSNVGSIFIKPLFFFLTLRRLQVAG